LFVTVHLHANLRLRTAEGMVSRLEMNLRPGSDVRAVLRELGLSDQERGLLIAINGRVGKPEQTLSEGDVLRLMPPISGGRCTVNSARRPIAVAPYWRKHSFPFKGMDEEMISGPCLNAGDSSGVASA
jgi:sulfur carrier protein ThiS